MLSTSREKPVVLAHQNQFLLSNKAVYTAESVACNSAGAVMQKLPKKRQKNKCITDRPTNRPTDQRTDTVRYRVAWRLWRQTEGERTLKKKRYVWMKIWRLVAVKEGKD